MSVLVSFLFKFVQQTGKNAGTFIIRAVIGHKFDISASTDGYATDCILCYHGMDTRSALDQFIQTIQQAAAASHNNTSFINIRCQFGRGFFQYTVNCFRNGFHRFFQRFQHSPISTLCFLRM